MKSLQSRAVAGGAVWATVVALAGANSIGGYLESLTLTRFDAFLAARHSQAVVALANTRGDSEAMPAQLFDPVYQRPFSGDYWQAISTDGRIVVSRSMADALLTVASPSDSDAEIAYIVGPAQQSLRALSQNVMIDDGSTWTVTVASSTAPIEEDRQGLRRRLGVAFAFVVFVASAGAFVLVLFTLRPLSQLRKDVIARREQEGELPTDDYPFEVKPLVADINDLLARNRDIIDRSRRQTVDLAHALKTPSAVLRIELYELQMQGADVQRGMNALDRLDAQLKRSFARMKASQDSASEGAVTSLEVSLGRLGRAFTTLAKKNGQTISFSGPPGLHAKINQVDFEEIIGNLLDNAFKWSRKTITLAATASEGWIQLVIEDDGDGFAEGQADRALISGQRLDESKPGTGLGLAIASDLIAAYRGTIELGRSEQLGGAKIIVGLRRSD